MCSCAFVFSLYFKLKKLIRLFTLKRYTYVKRPFLSLCKNCYLLLSFIFFPSPMRFVMRSIIHQIKKKTSESYQIKILNFNFVIAKSKLVFCKILKTYIMSKFRISLCKRQKESLNFSQIFKFIYNKSFRN